MIIWAQVHVGYEWCANCQQYHVTQTAPCPYRVIFNSGTTKIYVLAQERPHA